MSGVANFDAGDKESWYLRSITREEAQRVLVDKPCGCFFVRDSVTCPGDYVLCVKEETKVSHYIVSCRGGKYVIGDLEFKSLIDLIQHYKLNLLDTSRLKTPIKHLMSSPVSPERRPVDQYKALFDFAGTDEDDLPFKKGEILNIIEKPEADWWVAVNQSGTRTGSVPVPYIQKYFFDDGDDECVQLKVIIPVQEYNYHDLASLVAFFLGIAIGIIVFLILGWLVWRTWWRARKRRRQEEVLKEEEERRLRNSRKKEVEMESSESSGIGEEDASSDDEKIFIQQWLDKLRNESSADSTCSGDTDIQELRALIRPPDVGSVSSVAVVLLKPSEESARTELLRQDYSLFMRFDADVWSERFMTFLQIIRLLLSGKVVEGKMDHANYKRILFDRETAVEQDKRDAVKEHRKALRKLRKNKKLSADIQLREDEIQKLQRSHVINMHSILKQHLLEMVYVLDDYLSSRHIERIASEWTQGMLVLENKLSRELVRQHQAFRERFEICTFYFHRYVANSQYTYEVLRGAAAELGKSLADTGKIEASKLNKLVQYVNKEILSQEKKFEAQLKDDEIELVNKLKNSRMLKVKKLMEEMSKKAEEYLVKSTNKIDAVNELMTEFHDLLGHQRMEMDVVVHDIDRDDFNQLIELQTMSRDRVLGEMRALCLRELREAGGSLGVDPQTVEVLLDRYVRESAAAFKAEQERAWADLKERLKVVAEEGSDEADTAAVEMQQVVNLQERVISMVCANQVTLNESALTKLRLENKQNMQALVNQLMLSRLRQYRGVESKLQRNRRRFSETRRRSDSGSRRESETEEVKVAAERAKLRLRVRDRLAMEIQEGLEAVDKHLSATLGVLLVNVARRRAMQHRQDATVRELQEQIIESLVDAGDIDEGKVDRLIKEHEGRLLKVSETFNSTKEKAVKGLEDKCEARKLAKERSLEATLEQETKKKLREGLNTKDAFVQMLLSQRRQNALTDLGIESGVDAARSKDKLERELRGTLHEQVEGEEKEFLAQLAVEAGISRKDVKKAIRDMRSSKAQYGIALREEEDESEGLAKDIATRMKSIKSG